MDAPTHEDLRRLADTFDEESEDTYLSVYVDLKDPGWKTALADRLDEVASVVEARGGAVEPDGVRALGDKALALAAKAGDAESFALFASPVHDLEVAFALSVRVEDRVVLDSSPYLSPLAQAMEDVPSFALVVLDGARAAVWRVEEGDAHLEASKSMDLIGRHKKGGWSQMRYQRHRAGRVQDFLDQVIERLEELLKESGMGRIVVAGPGQAKDQFVERLPAHLAKMVDAVEDYDLDDPRDGPDVARFRRLLDEADSDNDEDVMRRLEDEVKGGGLGATGAFRVARAAAHGRVDTLVTLRGHTAGGRKCEEHLDFFAADGTCEACGDAGTEVDLLEEAMEHTLRTDGAVRSVEPPVKFLERRGGVGAFLRW